MKWHTLVTAAAIALASCGDMARLTVEQGMGPTPTLPNPKSSLVPTIYIAPAQAWPVGATPAAASGLHVSAFATGLSHPRWLYVLPNGDVLVAESNKPPASAARRSLKAVIMKLVMKRAGAGVPSADRITLLRDADGNGVAELRSPFLMKLHSPFGMALVRDDFYVANADAIVRFTYQRGQLTLTTAGVRLTELPGGPINHHWTKNIIADTAGTHLYATVGSNSNVGENGLDNERGRAAIWEVDLPAGTARLYATGLRNPNGMAWTPDTGKLWTVVNERDEIGSDLVPDYLTSVTAGGFYGWPYSYFGQHVDSRVTPTDSALVASALVPDYALGPHTGSLGLTYSHGAILAPRFGAGMFVGQHGSWNRKPRSGYKVIFIPFTQGRPNGAAVDVLTGFVSERGNAWGRPVGVAAQADGALLIADDVGNTIWRVTTNAHE